MNLKEFETHLLLLGFKQVPCTTTENYNRVKFSNGEHQVLIATMPTSSIEYLNIYIYKIDGYADPTGNAKEALDIIVSILKSRNTK